MLAPRLHVDYGFAVRAHLIVACEARGSIDRDRIDALGIFLDTRVSPGTLIDVEPLRHSVIGSSLKLFIQL